MLPFLPLSVLFLAFVTFFPVKTHAQSTPPHAVILAYSAIGDYALTRRAFNEQMEELSTGGYTVKPLPEIIQAFATKKPLPPKTVAITFDGADKSVLTYAYPMLKAKNFSFTVFVPTDLVTAKKSLTLSWKDLKFLKESGLANFGIHPSSYEPLSDMKDESIFRRLNNSLSTLRRELDVNARLLAHPFGEYSRNVQKISRRMGLAGAFGGQSGAAHAGSDRYAIPRFFISGDDLDIDSFKMAVESLPLPASEIAPIDVRLINRSPAIGFTVDPEFTDALKKLSCFSPGNKKPKMEIIGTRVELRLQKPFEGNHLRINCTSPVTAEDHTRYRWLGFYLSIRDTSLRKAAPKNSSVKNEIPEEFSVE